MARRGNFVLPAPMPVEELRALLRYDPDTGLLWWRISTHGRRMSQPAGSATKDRYVVLMLNGIRYQGHRVIWFLVTGDWIMVDHRDLDGTNNKWGNIRAATQQQNGWNRDGWAGSGFKGVYRSPSGKWYGRIRVDGRNINFPSRDTIEAAHADYCEAARREYGEFARID